MRTPWMAWTRTMSRREGTDWSRHQGSLRIIIPPLTICLG